MILILQHKLAGLVKKSKLYDNNSSTQSVQNFQIQQRYDGFEERQVSDDSSSEEENLLDKDIGDHDKTRKEKEDEKSSGSGSDGARGVPGILIQNLNKNTLKI